MQHFSLYIINLTRRPLKKVSQSCRPSVPSLQQRSSLTKCKKNTLCTLLPPTKPHLLRHRDSLLDLMPGHHGSLIRRQTAGLQNYFFLPVRRCRALPPTGEKLFQRQITTEPLLVPQDFVLFDRFPSHDI